MFNFLKTHIHIQYLYFKHAFESLKLVINKYCMQEWSQVSSEVYKNCI